MKTRSVFHQGKEVIFSDFRNINDPAELVAENDLAVQVICSRPTGSVLSLMDITGSVNDNVVVERIKKSGEQVKPYIRKQAAVGVTGFKRVIADMIAFHSKKTVGFFDTVDEALDWLTSDQ